MPTGVQRQLRLRRRHVPPAVRLGGAGCAAAVQRALPRDAYLPPWPRAATAQVPPLCGTLSQGAVLTVFD